MRLRLVKFPTLILLLVPIVSFILYASTLPQTFVAVGDAAEFAVATLTNGIPHPSGYPLFILLGKLALLVPIENKLLLVNATSAVYGSLTAWLAALIVYKLTKSIGSSLFAGLTLSTSLLFWKYSVVSEVFTLNTLFALLLIYLTLTVKRSKGIYILMFVAGLSLSNHQTIVLLFPGIIFILWKRNILPRMQQTLYGIPILLLGLTPYLYFLWVGREYPLQNWENPDNFGAVLNIFFRRAYSTFNLAAVDLPVPAVSRQMLDYILLTVNEFTIIGFILFLLGIYFAWQSKRDLSISLLFSYIVSGIGFILLAKAPLGHLQLKTITERFLILPNVLFIIFIGLGHYLILKFISTYLTDYIERLGFIFIALSLGLPLYLGITHFAQVDERQNYFAKNLSQDILASTRQNALLMVTGDAKIFSLLYERLVENKRHDVALVFPALFSPERRDWYLPLLKRHFPEIQLPADINFDDEGELLTAIVKENLKSRPVVCACGFLRERVTIAVPSKTIGLVEEFLPTTPQDVTLEDVELENEAHYTKLKNMNPRPSFPLAYIESDILREYAFPYVRLAHVYLQQELYDDAERLYRKSLEIAPAYYRLYRNLGEIYEKKNNRNEAIKALSKYMELNPYDENISEVIVQLEKLRQL